VECHLHSQLKTKNFLHKKAILSQKDVQLVEQLEKLTAQEAVADAQVAEAEAATAAVEKADNIE
jgi:hypothetical protein